MNKVYAIQQPVSRNRISPGTVSAFDFSAAEKYGEVIVLVPNGRGILTPDLLIKHLEEQLVDFDPVYDYVIPVGDYAICFLVGMMLSKTGFIRILRWIPEAQSYQPLSLDIRG